jgi:hypothetical protein
MVGPTPGCAQAMWSAPRPECVAWLLHVACCCGAKSIRTRSAAADPTGSDGGTDHCEWRGRHRADQSDGDTRHAAATRRNEVHARMPSLSTKTKFKQNHAQSSHAGAPTLAYEYAIRVPCRDASLRGAHGEDLRELCAATVLPIDRY